MTRRFWRRRPVSGLCGASLPRCRSHHRRQPGHLATANRERSDISARMKLGAIFQGAYFYRIAQSMCEF
jgi:hypothetical protein